MGDLDRVTFTTAGARKQRAAGAPSNNSSISAGWFPTRLLCDVCIPVKVRMLLHLTESVRSFVRPSVARSSVRSRPLLPPFLPVSASLGPVRWDRTSTAVEGVVSGLRSFNLDLSFY